MRKEPVIGAGQWDGMAKYLLRMEIRVMGRGRDGESVYMC